MFEKLLENADLKKYDLSTANVHLLSDFLNKEEFVEIGVEKHSILGVKNHVGKEVLHTADENIAMFLRMIRDQFGEWQKINKISFETERQFNIHVKKSSMLEMVRNKLGANFVFNKNLIKKKIETINAKLSKMHDRLQGVFIVSTPVQNIIAGFDTRNAIFATKTSNEETLDDISWLKDAKKAGLLVICPDIKIFHTFLDGIGCAKLKIGRGKSKNIWTRAA